jgi:hypothetical protein
VGSVQRGSYLHYHFSDVVSRQLQAGLPNYPLHRGFLITPSFHLVSEPLDMTGQQSHAAERVAVRRLGILTEIASVLFSPSRRMKARADSLDYISYPTIDPI